MGRIGLGSDLNPLAVALSSAKVNPPTASELAKRFAQLRTSASEVDVSQAPAEIRMLYHPSVLAELLWLRANLRSTQRADRFIRALLLGSLHANYTPGTSPRGLSISMPNTFSMAPRYVEQYIAKHKLCPPLVNVLDFLEAKASRFPLPSRQATRGRAWLQDSRKRKPSSLLTAPARLIFTSPPYLEVIKYGKYNWIRLWFINEDPRRVDASLVATSSRDTYLAFAKDTLQNLRPTLRDDGYLCLMIGDVVSRRSGETINLAQLVLEEVAVPLGWRCVANIPDHLPIQQKVSRIWKGNIGKATRTDRILVLSPSARRRALPALSSIHWERANEWT